MMECLNAVCLHPSFVRLSILTSTSRAHGRVIMRGKKYNMKEKNSSGSVVPMGGGLLKVSSNLK